MPRKSSRRIGIMMRREKKTNGAARSQGHLVVVNEADKRALARLQALDIAAMSQAIASCNRPERVKTIVNEIKSLQQLCARLLDNNQKVREGLYHLELEARCRLLELVDRIKNSHGPGRGKRIRKPGKLFALDAAGIKRGTVYDYRDLLDISQADRELYEANCRAERRTPTLNGLLNATRRRQMLQRNVRNRPSTEDPGALFGSNVTEGDPSPAAEAHQTIRQFCKEDRLAHVAAILDEMPEREQRFITSLSDHRFLQDFVQGFYERRARPAEQRRFIAQLMALMAEDEPESNAPTNSSERDETTRRDQRPTKARSGNRRRKNRVNCRGDSSGYKRCRDRQLA
jgi:hypothetical protein